jgi:ABC-type antimicrobial peptide transport system permease subunit
MGLRMALGATARDVVRLVVKEGALQLVIGLVIGLSLAFGVTKLVMLMLFDVEPRDPAVFSSIVALILLVGLSASLLPALRATRVDPGVALRYE